ncbi:hypothetical protein P7K49_005931 [Saguinus oedipus]|uniref:Uncharacterized protein n=1 Tax=Saguinus oedipus TaxID=9490 RepID=A0ABQ9W1R6_SAGOE|nr:hypothetical protein P7K49_005931 [Saguinus oedipus]
MKVIQTEGSFRGKGQCLVVLEAVVWKLGWSPKPGGEFGTAFPEIPVEFLQEKEVFKEFIYRINTLAPLLTWVSSLVNCPSDVCDPRLLPSLPLLVLLFFARLFPVV